MTHHLLGMAEIAKMLGVSRQRVAQLVKSYDDFPEPEAELAGGRVWSRTAVESWIASHPERGESEEPGGEASKGVSFQRFTDDARRLIVMAQEEARLLKHNYIGTEHLLLGALRVDGSQATAALEAVPVVLEEVRSTVEELVGRGNDEPTGHIPFTPRAKKVLEYALREALKLNHHYIASGHLLLSLMRDGDGVAVQALDQLGVEIGAVREKATDLLTEGDISERSSPAVLTYGPSQDLPQPVREFLERRTSGVRSREVPYARSVSGPIVLSCSFCDKSQAQVKKLVAGPGVYICDECIELCNEIIEEESDQPKRLDVHARLDRIEETLRRLLERDDG